MPILSLGAVLHAWHALVRDSSSKAFAVSIDLLALSFVGVAVSLWPMIVPSHYTLWQAASHESTQAFILIDTLVLLPVILFYTGWSY